MVSAVKGHLLGLDVIPSALRLGRPLRSDLLLLMLVLNDLVLATIIFLDIASVVDAPERLHVLLGCEPLGLARLQCRLHLLPCHHALLHLSLQLLKPLSLVDLGGLVLQYLRLRPSPLRRVLE